MSPRIVPLLTVAALALPIWASPATAVVINFDTLANHTVVTNQFPAATFSSSTAGRVIRTLASSLNHTAPNVIVGYETGVNFDFFAELFVDFPTPVNNLSFYATGANDPGDIGDIDVFQNGVFSSTVNLIGGGSVLVADLQDLSAFANVTRIRVYGITDDSGISYDTFNLSPVPLPAALPLFLTALAGLGLIARRRRRKEAIA